MAAHSFNDPSMSPSLFTVFFPFWSKAWTALYLVVFVFFSFSFFSFHSLVFDFWDCTRCYGAFLGILPADRLRSRFPPSVAPRLPSFCPSRALLSTFFFCPARPPRLPLAPFGPLTNFATPRRVRLACSFAALVDFYTPVAVE